MAGSEFLAYIGRSELGQLSWASKISQNQPPKLERSAVVPEAPQRLSPGVPLGFWGEVVVLLSVDESRELIVRFHPFSSFV